MSDEARRERRREELELVRRALLGAGLGREGEDLERLLPWYRVHRDSAARISELPLSRVEPQIVFDPRWRG